MYTERLRLYEGTPEPTDTSVLWKSPNSDGTFTLKLFGAKGWSSAGGSGGLTPEQEAILDNAVTFDSAGNIELKEGTKILGTNESNTQYEIIGLNEYEIGGNTYDQVEVGSEHIHLNLNTNNDPTYGTHPTVDTPNGKEIVAYASDLAALEARIAVLESA